jgi:hypothetical protein
MMKIVVAGHGCRACGDLMMRVKRIVGELRIDAEVTDMGDPESMAGAGISRTPALIVDGTLISQGAIPTDNLLRDWLARAARHELP